MFLNQTITYKLYFPIEYVLPGPTTVDVGYNNTLGSNDIVLITGINNTVDTRTVFQIMILITGIHCIYFYPRKLSRTRSNYIMSNLFQLICLQLKDTHFLYIQCAIDQIFENGINCKYIIL